MSMLLTSNSTATAVAANGTIELGDAIHGCGRAIRLKDDNIFLNERGYFYIDISASISVTGTAALGIQLYADGVAVSGAVASETPGAAGSIVNLHIPWVYKKDCNCKPTKLTLVSTAAGSVNDVIVMVKS